MRLCAYSNIRLFVCFRGSQLEFSLHICLCANSNIQITILLIIWYKHRSATLCWKLPHHSYDDGVPTNNGRWAMMTWKCVGHANSMATLNPSSFGRPQTTRNIRADGSTDSTSERSTAKPSSASTTHMKHQMVTNGTQGRQSRQSSFRAWPTYIVGLSVKSTTTDNQNAAKAKL